MIQYIYHKKEINHMYRHHALHTPDTTTSAYNDIVNDAEKFGYMMSILNYINDMKDDEWFEIADKVKEENIPEFIKAVCVLYQYKAINISFNNEFTKFYKH